MMASHHELENNIIIMIHEMVIHGPRRIATALLSMKGLRRQSPGRVFLGKIEGFHQETGSRLAIPWR